MWFRLLQSWRHPELPELDFWWMLSEVLLLECGSEASRDEPPGNLQTTTEAVLRPKKKARVFRRIL